MKNIAVILAGGKGTRFGSTQPKQFSKLAGRAIIEYTVERFEKTDEIHEIIIVSHHQHCDLIWDLVRRNNWKKITKVIHGGTERFYSSFSALQSLIDYSGQCKILFHDAVRPFVSEYIIQNCLQALDHFDAVDVVIPSTDTLVEVNDNECITTIPSRAKMRRGQTPQAFRLATIRQAYNHALNQGLINFTCDCSVLRRVLPDVDVITVAGHESNIKITHPIDLFLAEKLLHEKITSLQSNPTKFGFLRDKNIVIFGGTSGIGFEIMSIAHSYGANAYIASRSYNNIDVTDLEGVTRYLAEIKSKHGRIDFIINSTGLLIKKPFDMLTTKEVMSLVEVNYLGVINVAIASKEHLSQSNGMLLNFASSSYTRGRACYALYSSSKAAVVNLTQALSDEWSMDKIRVNCINPERTATPMRTTNFGAESPDTLLSPSDVALRSLAVLGMNSTGVIFDIRRDN